jgi:hypothetical protein
MDKTMSRACKGSKEKASSYIFKYLKIHKTFPFTVRFFCGHCHCVTRPICFCGHPRARQEYGYYYEKKAITFRQIRMDFILVQNTGRNV